MKINDKFLIEISKIKEPEIFAGLAKVLKVKITKEDDDKAPRDFADVFDDAMKAFSKLNRDRKRELYKILKDCNRQGVTDNARNTKDTDGAEVPDQEVQ